MGKVSTMSVDITPGDCDPMGLLLPPRTQCWIDAAAAGFFTRCGLPDWHELQRTRGLVGMTPLAQHARFLRSANSGDRLTITTELRQWRAGDFVQRHLARRGDELIFECVETRAFLARDPLDADGVRLVPLPPDLRALCA
jgi:4-hydroxybenzoyl-CoA thioesterase